MSLVSPALKAVAQLDDPTFTRVLLRSLGWAIVGFAALVAVIVWAAQALVGSIDPSHDWLRWLAAILSGAGAAAFALYLFLPVAALIATLFVNSVADAVEHRYYPHLPPARPAPIAEQAWDGVALGLRILALEALGLVLFFVLPGVGGVIGWAIAAWSIGRGLFVAVAMRRMDRPSAILLYQGLRFPVLVQGGLVAAGSLIPLANLLMPVLGVAALVHVMHEPSGSKA